MESRRIRRPDAKLQLFGSVDEGKQLEIFASIDGVGQCLGTIVADDADESLWFEFFVNGELIQVPLDLIAKAVNIAPGEVHSESWYIANVYPKSD